ncbi:MAG: protein translocase subunit SecD [Acidobacteria bacterium]|nr:protein translocase subunit SecD [Acidobacteriota bacterium]
MQLRWKILLILAVIGFAVWQAFPLQETIRLGLDLRGGLNLVMQVRTDDAVRAEVDQVEERLAAELKEAGIAHAGLERSSLTRIRIRAAEEARAEELRGRLREGFAEWSEEREGDDWVLDLGPQVVEDVREVAVRQALETIRERVDQFGVAEPVIQRQGLAGGERILVQLPGVENPERVKEVFITPAFLEWKLAVMPPDLTPDEFRQVVPDSEERLAGMFGGVLPEDVGVYPEEITAPDGTPVRRFWPLKRASAVSGRDLKNSRRDQGRFGEPVVGFTLTAEAGRRFEKLTRENRGQLLAILLDGQVISAPRINDVISDQGIIEGGFTVEGAEDLALQLRSGALPATVVILEERTVGPSLGADSIRQGVRASLAGSLVVAVFMILYYKFSGVNAVIALALNLVLLLGAMAYLGATLTLPGIAGIALTVGMAVDANVLVFERIREERRLGRTVRSAVAGGFSKALITIVDSNVTTWIAAVFLYGYGTGPVKGFAVTLIIGLLASMFTALFVSRTLFDLLLGRRRATDRLSI